MPDTPPSNKPDEELSLGEIATGVGNVLRRLGPGGPLAVIASTLPMVGVITLAFLFNLIGPWLKDQETVGLTIYVVGVAVFAGLAVFPTHIQAALGGWAFGFAIGTPASLAGILGAALLGYAIALRATGDRAIELIAERPKLKAVYTALLQSGFWRALLIVTLVRAAVTPFALTNFALAATRVHPMAYAIGTVVGIAPRTAAAVYLAVGLKHVTDENPHKWWVWIGSLVLTIIVVAVISVFANRAVERVTRDGSSPAGDPE